MDQSTNSLYCSIYNFLVQEGLSSTKKSFLKETKFDTKSLNDASILKLSLPQLFKDNLANQKKSVINEESSDSSSSSDSDSDSEDEKPVAKTATKAATKTSDSDSSSSDSDSDSEDEKPVAKTATKAAAKSSSDSDSSSSDSDSDSEDEKLELKKRKAEASSDSSSSSSGSDSESEIKITSTPAPKKKKVSSVETPGGETFKAYIKGLPWTTTDVEVSDFFSDCGNIVSCELPLGEGGRSSGTAFVTFDSRGAFDLAMAKDEAIWPGTERWLKITEAKSFDSARSNTPGVRPEGCDTVFVGNLPWDVEESQLMELFSTCGEVHQVRFAMGEDGSFRGFAHVRFGAEENTDAAVALFGTDINGRAIRVDYAPPRNRDSLGGGKGGGRGGKGGKGGGRGDFGGKGGKGGGRGTAPYSANKNKGSIATPQGTKMTFD